MKHNLKLLIITLAIALPLTMASSVLGIDTYKNPIYGPTSGNDNKEFVPITIGDNPQAKLAGLTLNTLEARGKALLSGNTYIGGYIAGAIGDTVADSVVSFGNQSGAVSVVATGDINAKEKLQADNLVSGGRVCSTAEGKLVPCSGGELTCPLGTIPNFGPGECQPAPCIAQLKFEGTFRNGRIMYTGAQNHPELTVIAMVEGVGNGNPATGGGRGVTFTIPENSTMSYYNNTACGNSQPYTAGAGCGIEVTPGFYSGYTAVVTPEFVPGGKYCTVH